MDHWILDLIDGFHSSRRGLILCVYLSVAHWESSSTNDQEKNKLLLAEGWIYAELLQTVF